jgi:hypothetical protein
MLARCTVLWRLELDRAVRSNTTRCSSVSNKGAAAAGIVNI